MDYTVYYVFVRQPGLCLYTAANINAAVGGNEMFNSLCVLRIAVMQMLNSCGAHWQHIFHVREIHTFFGLCY